MNRRLSSAALVAAAALTFSLGSPVAAHAAESGSGSLERSTATTAPAATPATITAGSVRLTGNGYLTSSSSVYAGTQASVGVPAGWDWYVKADVYVNGVLRSAGRYVASNTYPKSSVSWPKSAGYGTAQLRNVSVTAYSPDSSSMDTGVLPNSNTVRVLRTIDYRAYLKISKRGSKATAKASSWRVYQPNGSLVRVGKKVKLQRQVKGKWRTYKNIKVNSKGNGKIKFTQKKKYRYRVFIPTTTTIQGGYTRPFKI